MGMFDWVWVPPRARVCPKCAAELPERSFQSKDGKCCLDFIPYTQVNTLYAVCYGCKSIIYYRRKPAPQDPRPLESFDQTVQPIGTPAPFLDQEPA